MGRHESCHNLALWFARRSREEMIQTAELAGHSYDHTYPLYEMVEKPCEGQRVGLVVEQYRQNAVTTDWATPLSRQLDAETTYDDIVCEYRRFLDVSCQLLGREGTVITQAYIVVLTASEVRFLQEGYEAVVQ